MTPRIATTTALALAAGLTIVVVPSASAAIVDPGVPPAVLMAAADASPAPSGPAARPAAADWPNGPAAPAPPAAPAWAVTKPTPPAAIAPAPQQHAARLAVAHVVIHHRRGIRHVTSGGRTWRVRPGQTLTLISHATHATRISIVRANGIVDEDLIYAGETLRIPGGSR